MQNESKHGGTYRPGWGWSSGEFNACLIISWGGWVHVASVSKTGDMVITSV